jgi:diacylglycerol O-acyltransferase / trehalose O-mycolyltransferase
MRIAVTAALAAASLFALPTQSNAQPLYDGTSVVKAQTHGRTVALLVHSAAMDKNIEIDVQRPVDASKPAPTLYLFNGLDAGESDASWTAQTDVLQFLGAKDVNVVQPIGGRGSYYVDWDRQDPELDRGYGSGPIKWETFLSRELPPVIDSYFHTTGVDALAGMSTSGTSVLILAEDNPGLYKSVAAYSGCAEIADQIGHSAMQLSVEKAGGDIDDMYGPEHSPGWAAHDPVLHADKLRGTNLFVSAGNGIPGKYDVLDGPHALPGSSGLANQIIVGGVIESAVNYCSRNLQAKLTGLGIPATYDFTATGTHSWGYWQDALKASWPVLARGLGVA